ncbi:hypothetical protein [Silvimonas soli]|uniref:hypothetical protein n=1 Tax=Silvimonas soli TaxID=2980100 RepID=UPI0024B36290|nr:hypothetical protein [Silvimonas soli]
MPRALLFSGVVSARLELQPGPLCSQTYTLAGGSRAIFLVDLNLYIFFHESFINRNARMIAIDSLPLRLSFADGRSWLAQGWRLFRKKPWQWLGLSIAFEVLMLLSQHIPWVIAGYLLPATSALSGCVFYCFFRQVDLDGQFSWSKASQTLKENGQRIFTLLCLQVVLYMMGNLFIAWSSSLPLSLAFDPKQLQLAAALHGLRFWPVAILALLGLLTAFCTPEVVLRGQPVLAAYRNSIQAGLRNVPAFLGVLISYALWGLLIFVVLIAVFVVAAIAMHQTGPGAMQGTGAQLLMAAGLIVFMSPLVVLVMMGMYVAWRDIFGQSAGMPSSRI